MKNKIVYNTKVGFKLWLINILSMLIMMIPSVIVSGFSLFAVYQSILTGTFNISTLGIGLFVSLILFLVSLTVQGYLVNKFERWIFK